MEPPNEPPLGALYLRQKIFSDKSKIKSKLSYFSLTRQMAEVQGQSSSGWQVRHIRRTAGQRGQSIGCQLIQSQRKRHRRIHR